MWAALRPYRPMDGLNVLTYNPLYRFLISTVMWARFSHASLGSWGVVDQLAQAAFMPHLGLTTVEVGTVSRWRGVPPW